MIHSGRATRYAALDRHVTQIANGLAGFGIRHQDRIGCLGKNSDLYLELLLGAARAGAVLVPLNWRLAAPEKAQAQSQLGLEPESRRRTGMGLACRSA
jgi:acyl-CoA synthetase (AMP-forming)/AMP-acid ligase II